MTYGMLCLNIYNPVLNGYEEVINMKLLMYGVNDERVAYDSTQHYQLDEDKCIQQLTDLKNLEGVHESVILYSKHRTEYYFLVDENAFNHGAFLRYLSDASNRPLESVILETFSKFNYDVIAHVYRSLTGVDPRTESTEELMDALDNGIYLSKRYTRKRLRVLKDIFYTSIHYVVEMLKTEDFNDIMDSQTDSVIKEIVREYENVGIIRFLVSGTNPKAKQIARMLFRSGARYVRIEGETFFDSQKTVDELNYWANWIEPKLKRKVFFSVDVNSMPYHVAAADSIVITDEVDEEKRLNVINEEVEQIEYNAHKIPKKQLVIDLNQQRDNIEELLISNSIIYKNYSQNKSNISEEKKQAVLENLFQHVSVQIETIFDVYKSYVKAIEN